MHNKLLNAYKNGYNSARYGFTYIHPYSSQEEIDQWAKGYTDGKKDSGWREVEDGEWEPKESE